ncbi:MAG: hypothetical protein IJE73_05115 [Muribaculaceae bacterium]|nr:hypothetical protein [Muribaculaceae bacterium]
MKQILAYLFALLSVPFIIAQTDSVVITYPTDAVTPPLTITGSTTRNYVSKAVFTQGVKRLTSVTPARAIITTTFYDGFGRKQQTVLRNNNSGKDLADYYEYDNRGRVVRQYLPGAISGSGNYASLDQITASHTSLYPGDATNAFVSNEYDASVTPRTIITKKTGNDWHASAGTTSQYHINKTSGKYSCNKFTLNGGNNGSLNNSGIYPSGRLHVTSVIDEDNRETIIFKDFNDSIYLHRRVLDENNYADTYYIYDNIGNIRYVIPPMASVALVSSTGIITDDNETLQDYCYIYKYDSRNRLEEKKLPGAESIYYIYDGCDLLRYSQDGNQRYKNVWTAYAYDSQFRLAYTCEISFPELTLIPNIRSQMLGRQDKSYFVGEAGEVKGYSNVVNPGTINKITLVNYYDNYDFLNLYSAEKDSMEYKVVRNYDWRYENETTPTHSVLGEKTGVAISVLGDSVMLPGVWYYDKDGNVIQSCEKNHLGGYDRKLYRLSFVGNPISMRHEHSSADTSCVDVYTYSYDIQLRPTSVSLSHNGSESMFEYNNTYNSLGQLSSQALGEGLIETTYQYNIQGWTTHIDNNKFHQQLYYETHPYGGEESLTGNVCAMSWASDGRDTGGNIAPTIQRTYLYDYDRLDRLTSAQYVESEPRSDITYQTTNTPDYSTAYTYDLNGNIISLRRNGLMSREPADTYELWTFGEIDNVEMTYNGNQLSRIDDADEDIVLSSSMDIIETPLQTAYDRNGNLSYFSKRGISRVRYNSLNLPESYLLGNERVRIVYDATGRKLSEIYEVLPQSLASTISEMETEETAESQTNDSLWVQISRRDYSGNYIYQNGNISMIITPAGYISGSMRYYYLKDYQGNNSVVLNQNGVVQQINHYYPYGSLMGEVMNTSSQPYRYGGKELVTLGGLNLSDFGARWLDSPSGTFTTMDPLCEDFQHLSPYLYCAGNSIKYIDPSGMDIWEVNGQGEIVNRVINKEEDKIIMVNDDGSAKIDEEGNEVSISFEYGTIISQKSRKHLVDNEVVDVDIFRVRGDQNGEILFKFLSDNVTTTDVGIEYSLFQTGHSGSRGLNFVSTSHMPGADASYSLLWNNQIGDGYFLRKAFHSHPIGTSPSGPDQNNAKKITSDMIKRYNTTPLFFIYHVPTKKIIQYK